MQSILSEVVGARKGIAYHDLQQPSEPGELSLLEVLCAPILMDLLKHWLLVFYEFLSHACMFGFMFYLRNTFNFTYLHKSLQMNLKLGGETKLKLGVICYVLINLVCYIV